MRKSLIFFVSFVFLPDYDVNSGWILDWYTTSLQYSVSSVLRHRSKRDTIIVKMMRTFRSQIVATLGEAFIISLVTSFSKWLNQTSVRFKTPGAYIKIFVQTMAEEDEEGWKGIVTAMAPIVQRCYSINDAFVQVLKRFDVHDKRWLVCRSEFPWNVGSHIPIPR